MPRCVLPVVIALLATLPRHAQALDAAVWLDLGRVKSLQAEFTQVQTRKILKRPIESRGTVRFDRPATLVWAVLTPARSTFALDGNMATMDVPDVGVHEVLDLGAVPEANRLATSLMVWLQADPAAVARDFAATYTTSPPFIVLVPLDPTLGRVVKTLELGLAEAPWRVDHARIVEPTGDTVDIRFSKVVLDGVPVPDPAP